MVASEPRTILLLRLLQLTLFDQLVGALREFQLSPVQYLVLSIVRSHGKYSTAELARRFHIAPQSMNQIVKTLGEKDLITRNKAPDHGRILHIRLTARGKSLLSKCDERVDELEQEAFEEFSQVELLVLRELLQRALAANANGETPVRLTQQDRPGLSETRHHE